ncbi:MAG: tRNA (adenosine(37)-N6)-dimethylallyltransferase MiaA [Chloroflexota bacterium]|nr:tRNA (adenosine(37)-N6)-dimethylallyltransferase MiaA [Chloroflexota bacterium]
MRSPPLAALLGPTASGKTDLALAIARQLPVEILVADSRQVYRGMDVATAKPDAVARAAVPHHLIDLVLPDQPFSLANWLAAARQLIPEITARGRLPLVVGGTGLYVSALLDGYQLDAAPPSPQLRRSLSEELEQLGVGSLAARLERLDPAAAARTDLRNPRRVIRAFELAAHAHDGGGLAAPIAEPWPGPLVLIGLHRSMAVLRRRIAQRTAGFFGNGQLDEVRGLLAAGYGPDLSPMSGHGYRETARYLAGESDLDEAIADTVRRTAQYAKRQMTWFRRDPRIAWLDAGEGPADDPVIVERAVSALSVVVR